MYQLNESELWTQHRHDLLREAEGGRLARRLRSTRPRRTARFLSALFGEALDAPAHLRVEGGGRA